MNNFKTNSEIKKIKESIENSFNGLHFDEETHSYILNGMQLTSVTTNINQFSDTFNSYYASEAKGDKMLRQNASDRRTGVYYRRRWKYLADESKNMGSRVHLFAETAPYFDLPQDWREQAVIDFYNWLPDNYIVLFIEFRLYDKETFRAGTIDGILYNTDTDKLVLFDWKTNRRNINEVYKNKKLKKSFKHLKATSLNKYSLQLSDYANMISSNTDFEVEERWVIWLRKKDVNEKDSDRNEDYSIQKVKPDINEELFKLYKVKDYSNSLIKEYNIAIDKMKDECKPEVIKRGAFVKKKTKTYSKRKSLFSKN